MKDMMKYLAMTMFLAFGTTVSAQDKAIRWSEPKASIQVSSTCAVEMRYIEYKATEEAWPPASQMIILASNYDIGDISGEPELYPKIVKVYAQGFAPEFSLLDVDNDGTDEVLLRFNSGAHQTNLAILQSKLYGHSCSFNVVQGEYIGSNRAEIYIKKNKEDFTFQTVDTIPNWQTDTYNRTVNIYAVREGKVILLNTESTTHPIEDDE